MKPRVAFIDYFPTHYRRRLYEELARRMDADFYFYADERERFWNPKLPLVTGGNFRRVEIRRMRIGGQAFMPGIVRALTPQRYDAVIKSLNGRIMLPLTYLTSRARGIPFVLWTGMWFHPRTPFHRATRPLVESLYRQVPAIVAYGEHVARALLDIPGVARDKVFVAGQAVEPERFASVRRSEDGEAPKILFVGQLEERKGVTDLLEAFASLSDLPARLRLVGNGSLEAEIRAQVAGRPSVELVGYVPQEQLDQELALAACLVLPSVTTRLDREPWGLVVNEAMHAGVPVVATDAVGAAAGGLVESGRNGYVVPERDPGALAGALRKLIADRSHAADLGERAREDVKRFTYERMADAFEAAVQRAIDTRRGRGG
jgi:glycosyltransferase involved in cell wall biosynthesis